MKRFGWAQTTLISALFLLLPGMLTAGIVEGTVTVKGTRDAQDAVIYVDEIMGKAFAAPEEHAKMDQRNMVFSPHVLPILVGTSVDFYNSDAVLHNIFTPDKIADKFSLGTWPQGQVKSYTFKNVGSAVMLCNVHPEMEAFVVVLPTPYFTKTGPDGRFKIEGVPAGTYVVRVWHEKLKAQAVSVAVPVEQTATVTFALSK